MKNIVLVIVYVAAIVAANLTVAEFGPWVSPINAFMLIGLDLALRDHLHDQWRGPGLWPRMLGVILAGGAISYMLNPSAGQIAVASAVAFVVSGAADAIAYHLLRDHRFLLRSNGSNVAGALVDSLTFPTLAFGALLPGIVALQFGAKVAGGAVWSMLLSRFRPV